MNTVELILFVLKVIVIVIFSYSLITLILNGNVRRVIKLSDKKDNTDIRRDDSISGKFYIKYIEKTNIKKYIPFANLYTLGITEVLIALISYLFIFKSTQSHISSLILALFAACIPLIVLDFVGNYNMEKTKNELASFISVLARWHSVKNDMFYAFEKAGESGLNEPLNTFVKDFNIQIKCGIHPIDALDRFSERFNDVEFKDAILNIKQNIRFRGDGNALLKNMESRLYRMQEERNKRKISTLSDRITIICVIAVVFYFAWYFLNRNRRMSEFYFKTPTGKIMLLVFCLLFLVGIFIFISITKTSE